MAPKDTWDLPTTLDALFEGGLWLLLALSPILVGVANIDAYRTIQATFSLIVIFFLLAIWAIRNTLAEQWHTILKIPAIWPILVFLGWALFSTTQSPSMALSMQSWISLGCYVALFFAVAQWARTKDRRRRLLWPMMIAFGFNCFLALLQYKRVNIIGLSSVLPDFKWIDNYLAGLNAPARLGSAAGVLGNQNVMGDYMVAPLAVMMALAIAYIRSWKGAVLVILSGFGLVCLFETMTRGAWIGMGVGLVLMLGLLLFRFREQILRHWKFTLTGIVTLVVGAAVLGSLIGITPQAVFNRATGQHRTLDQRVYVWDVAKRLANEKPILGQGLGSFKVLYFNGLSREYKGNVPSILTYRFVQAHNDYLQNLSETGYPGFLLMLTALGWFYISQIRKLNRLDNHDAILGIGELTGLVATAVCAISGFPFHIAASSVVMAVLAGTLAARGEPVLKNEFFGSNLTVSLECVGFGVLALAMMAVVSLQYQADILTKRGMEYNQRQDFYNAELNLRKAIAYDGARGDAKMQYALTCFMTGRGPDAIKLLEESRATYDDVALHYYLGYAYRAMGRPQDARQEYLHALSYYPNTHPTCKLIRNQIDILDRSMKTKEATK